MNDLKDNFIELSRREISSSSSQDKTYYYLRRKAKISKSMGYTRSTKWWHTLALQNRVAQVEPYQANAFAAQIDKVITIMKGVYGENWDMTARLRVIDGKIGLSPMPTIYYPEFTITNKNNESQQIKGLFVSIYMKYDTNDVLRPTDIRGTRSYYSFPEWFNGYRHSHLSSYQPTEFKQTFQMSSFCTGENEMGDLLLLMQSKFDENKFELFLHTLDGMMKWESIEGVPHCNIRDNVVGSKEHVSSLTSGNVYRKYERFRAWLRNLDVDFAWSEGRYKIVQNAKFVSTVRAVLTEHLQSEWKDLLVTRKEGRLYGYAPPTTSANETNFLKKGEKPFTYLQGRKIYFQVGEYDGELSPIEQYDVHPMFLKRTINELEKELYTAAVRKATVDFHS